MTESDDIMKWLDRVIPARFYQKQFVLASSAIRNALSAVQPSLETARLSLRVVLDQVGRESLIFDAAKLAEASVTRQLLLANQWDALELLRAASFNDILTPSDEADQGDETPQITVKTLIIPGGKTQAGTLVKGVSTLWFQMLRMIQDDPDSIHHIDCWKWEELLAGAYKQDGWEIVTLTPKKSDKGIDVIAERKGWGKLSFLLMDQMKAYKPGHLIGPDEIREMKGVMLDHPEASKGMITTTSGFTAGAVEAAKNLAPRLELRPREELVGWLASIATEKLRS